jgi:hypothetical protein
MSPVWPRLQTVQYPMREGKLTNAQTELAVRERILIEWYVILSTAVCR